MQFFATKKWKALSLTPADRQPIKLRSLLTLSYGLRGPQCGHFCRAHERALKMRYRLLTRRSMCNMTKIQAAGVALGAGIVSGKGLTPSERVLNAGIRQCVRDAVARDIVLHGLQLDAKRLQNQQAHRGDTSEWDHFM